MKLRDYQQRTIDQLYAWFRRGNKGNPVVVLPTGAGKSLIIAALCKDALTQWPDTRVLMLTHVKELIEQNAHKMRKLWPNAPMGIYSASIGQRDLTEPITFAGVQSVAKKADEIGHVDLVLIDECHLLNNKKQGNYRRLLSDLAAINPHLRVIGLTASPYRLGQGMLTEGDEALFSDIIEPVSIEELIAKGYLSVLRSKVTDTEIDVSGVHKRGGEFIASELEQSVDTSPLNLSVSAEIVRRGAGCKSWLVFCVGISHAENLRDCIRAHGISCETVHGGMTKKQREQVLADFTSGRLQCVTNCNVLTTGFDHPDLDLIAMARPTASPGLYQQMIGRGLRVKSHTDHCLVLDFAGNIARHGPVTNIRPPRKKGEREGGEAPVKVCDQCQEIVHPSVMVCPCCGFEWPAREPDLKLRDDDIMGEKATECPIDSWRWDVHKSRAGNEMIRITYYPRALNEAPIKEYLPLLNPGVAGVKASRDLYSIAHGAGVRLDPLWDLSDLAQEMSQAPKPSRLAFFRDGKFHRITDRTWDHE